MKVKNSLLIICLFPIMLTGCANRTIPSPAAMKPPQTEEQPVATPDRAIEFADPIIEQSIRNLLKKSDGGITETELLTITVLGDAEGIGGSFGDIKGEISTLSDLKWLKNLKVLSLGDCGIQSLEGIEGLGKLKILRLRRNHISDLTPLCGLTELTELDLSENPISDTSALFKLVNIERLGLGDCVKIDLSSVSGMSRLKSLYAPYSNIIDISMLADKTDLEYLQLFHNSISDISSLKNLIKLTYLNLSLNNISNIDTLDGLPNLETVGIDNNPIPQERLEAFYTPKETDFITRELRQKIGSDMSEYVFELLAFKTKSSTTYYTTKITLRNAESGEIIQELVPSEYTFDGMNVSLYGDNLGFMIEDMNFDHYADIRIAEFLPAGPNIPYICWVWDKETEQYVYDPALSGIPTLEVDHDNKIIYTFGRSSASEHYARYYRYIDGILTLIKEVRTGFLDQSDPQQGYSFTYELQDGQWNMTIKEKINIKG